MELIFASHNENKVSEIRELLPNSIQLLSLNGIGFHQEIEETGSTLEENAQIKAETIYKQTGKNVFADDSGLFVDFLEGAPGVYSARYAGTGKSEDNIEKLLTELKEVKNRNAYFQTIICLIWKGNTHFISGKIHGQILTQKKGEKGFGYDPIFIPDGYRNSFAEMTSLQKNQISHRAKAVQKLINFIQK
ncbi:MAG: RdgB/HAM1 family non-canonical purine NTP pyrophosphatase [Moheibacter sp.]